MKVLILDDDARRHEAFHDAFEGHAVVHAFTFHEFVKAIRSNVGWDAVYLDHDLGDLHEPDRKPGGDPFDGRDAVHYLAALPKHKWPKRLVVHSLNKVRGDEMALIAERAGLPVARKPFALALR